MMDINIYLPDDVGKRAKEAELPLSRMLRDAVREELARRDAIAETLSDGIAEHEVELSDYTGVITGKFLGQTLQGEQIFVTDDQRVIVYNQNSQSVEQLDEPEVELAAWLQQASGHDSEVVAVAMRALGFRPRVRL